MTLKERNVILRDWSHDEDSVRMFLSQAPWQMKTSRVEGGLQEENESDERTYAEDSDCSLSKESPT